MQAENLMSSPVRKSRVTGLSVFLGAVVISLTAFIVWSFALIAGTCVNYLARFF